MGVRWIWDLLLGHIGQTFIRAVATYGMQKFIWTSPNEGTICEKKAIEKVKDNEKIDFVFADVNCTLGMRLVDGTFKFFSTENELDNIIRRLNT